MSSPQRTPAERTERTPALTAAQRRIKTLLETVRRLEEERGAALLRVAELEGLRAMSDRELAQALSAVMPVAAKRTVSCRVLCVLLCLTEGPLSATALRVALGVAQATASEWLQEAVGLGVVTLTESPQDRRQSIAQLTPKGWVFARDRRERSERSERSDRRGRKAR